MPASHRLRRASGNGGEFSPEALGDSSGEPEFKVDPEAYIEHKGEGGYTHSRDRQP
jgi:hypothetical protein